MLLLTVIYILKFMLNYQDNVMYIILEGTDESNFFKYDIFSVCVIFHISQIQFNVEAFESTL